MSAMRVKELKRFSRIVSLPCSVGLWLALALSIASGSHAVAQTGEPARTQDETTTTPIPPSSGTKERRFAPGTIAKAIVLEASRLTNDAVAWGRKLHELELELR